MSVAFREAVRSDVPAIIDLLVDDGLGKQRETADLDIYYAAFDGLSGEAGNTLIVGERGGQVIATYQLTFIAGLSLKAARRAQIESVRVAGHLRGQGIGHLMLADAENRATLAECSLIQLTMNKSRTETARFYERLGFTPSHIGYKRKLL